MAHVLHYSPGASTSSVCGRHGLWHAGLAYTRDPLNVTCQRCKAWLRAQARREPLQPYR